MKRILLALGRVKEYGRVKSFFAILQFCILPIFNMNATTITTPDCLDLFAAQRSRTCGATDAQEIGNDGVLSSSSYYDCLRICWDYNQRRFVNGGVYSRLKVLSDGTLVCAYSAGADVVLRKSVDGRWDSPIRVATDSLRQYSYTNSELIELSDGTQMYAWNARSTNGSGKPYKIMAAYSKDGGKSWTEPQNIFVAGTTWDEGCWEPVMLQLPSGELQIYFANEYLVPDKQQNITMMRSFDNGVSWQKPEVVSFRKGARDGMPVPVYLKNHKGIVFAIEDNGLNGTFKPVIIRTATADNWKSGAVLADSPNRWPALAPTERLHASVYAGAPYLIQLSSGETLLSVQSSESRLSNGTLDCSIMQVYVGDDEARNFSCKSTPFPFEPNSKVNTLWCAMTQLDENRVMATASVSGMKSSNGIWTSTGYIFRPMQARYVSHSPTDWSRIPTGMFIGAESPAQAFVRTAWSVDSLFFRFAVKDACIRTTELNEPLSEGDGVELFIDPRKSDDSVLTTGQFRCLVGANGKGCTMQTVSAEWVAWKSGFRHCVQQTADGYEVLMAVPWKTIGGRPPKKDLTVCFSLHNRDDDMPVQHENMSGGEPHNPKTWLRCVLKCPY